jgi:hypothetical protein
MGGLFPSKPALQRWAVSCRLNRRLHAFEGASRLTEAACEIPRLEKRERSG